MQNDLPHEVLVAIQRVLDINPGDETDPVDLLAADFTPIPVLNELFPDESSLAHIDNVSSRLVDTQRKVEEEIESLHLELARTQDPSKMQLIQEMISDLFGQMSRIREKATESEAVVKDITKDIQVLDLAKKNLILSMTTLKRLQMLVNALTQLEDLVKEKRYPDIAQTLSAVKEISASFKAYSGVQRIAQVLRRIQEVQGELRTLIDSDFDSYFLQDPGKPIKPSVIADACNVVDVLGLDVRNQLIDRYVALELKEYRRIFRISDEAGQIDNISRRFSWFRRLLQSHETEQGRVYPAEWRVSWCLLGKFSESTRDDFSALLSKMGTSLTVNALLDNLQLTTDFENSMANKYATPFLDILKAVAPDPKIVRPISAAFGPHMGVFVDAQDRILSEMLAPHRKGRGAGRTPRPSLEALPEQSDGAGQDAGSPASILPSSTELFYFYAQTLEQCAKLSTGKALYDLCLLHKKWLRIYADEVLVANLKRPANQSRKSTETRFDVNEIKHSCTIINTAEYCQTTAQELEHKLRQKVDPEFKEKISLQSECENFLGVISAGIIIQLRELEAACDGSFLTMSRTNWSLVNQVSGNSPYTVDLAKAAEQVVAVVKPLIEQKRFVRNFLDKACGLILTKFTNALVKSRPLRETGAEQLLIDLQTVKAFLQKLPGDALQTTSYVRSLAKSTAQLEALLKVIVTPVDPPEGFILNYTLLIGDASFSNFQKILDLKGTPPAEQNNLLDSFLTITSTKTELEGASFLSSLDMDPVLIGNTLGEDVLFASLASAPLTPVGGASATAETAAPRAGEQRREVFSDFRRLVSFGLRRETSNPT